MFWQKKIYSSEHSSLVSAYGNAGDIERMMELFNAMEGKGACHTQGMIDTAQNLEGRMIRSETQGRNRFMGISETFRKDEYLVKQILWRFTLSNGTPRSSMTWNGP